MAQESAVSLKDEVKDFLKDVAIIVIVVVIIRTVLFVPFQINGASMSESYYNKQFIIVDKLSYKVSDVARWDVVVFKPHVSNDKEFFIKRVIGIAGDSVKVESWKVYLKKPSDPDYIELDEWYLSEENKGSTFVRAKSSKHVYDVPAGKYFVMWDNRNSSTDSRTCFKSCSYPGATNFIKNSDLSGKVWIDLGYFDWIRIESWFNISFWEFKFIQPELWIDSSPKWFSSPDSWEY